MKKILYLAILAGAFFAWQQGKLPFPSFGEKPGSFDENGKPALVIFTRDNCQGYCEKQLKRLDRRRIPYTEHRVDVDNSEQEAHKFWKKMGRQGFPYLIAGNERFSGDSPWQLSNFLAASFGNQYLTHREKRYYKEHFNRDGTPRIVMYGTSWCGYCRKLREELQQENIDFLEIDVEKHADFKTLINTMGIGGYPTVWIGYKRLRSGRLGEIQKHI
ncbi:MAG: hypothetical protein K6L73_03025 [Cellvibrionaceae bacterium]